MAPRFVLRLVAVVAVQVGLGLGAMAQPVTIGPGRDYWVCAQPTMIEFGAGGLPPIPADFFNPGSEPFEGKIWLTGNPASASLPADTIVQRTGGSPPLDVGQGAQVPIEIIALSLRSVAPVAIGPTFFDVFFEVDTTQPRSGTAHVHRGSALGGTCGYSAQFSARLRFRVPGGVEDDYVWPIGPVIIETQRTMEFPRFAHAPFAPVLPLQGPNFFPMDGTTTGGGTTAGLRLSWLPSFVAIDDCEGNGVDDVIDVLEGAPDRNFNGTPDLCEVHIKRILQDSFPDGEDGWLLRHSDRGELEVHIVEPMEDEVWWLSVAVPGRWICFNVPITEVNGAGLTTGRTLPFELPQQMPGQQVIVIEIVEMRLTLSPLDITMPPPPIGSVPLFDLPVEEHVVRGGAIGVPDAAFPVPPMRPWRGEDFIFFGFDGLPKEIVRRREVPGVSESTNQCGPGAAARSLEWMRNLYCLNYPADTDTLGELLDALSFEMGYVDPAGVGSIGQAFSGIQSWIDTYGQAGAMSMMAVSNPDPALAFAALQEGCDVLGVLYLLDEMGMPTMAQMVTVVGGSRCGDRYTFSFRDDFLGGDMQKDNVPDDPNRFKAGGVVQSPDGTYRLMGYGDNQWAGFVRICPTRKVQIDAANKWNTQASGGPAGGFRELVNGIIGGAPVTDADRMNLLKWSCNMVDSLQFAVRRIGAECSPAPAQILAMELLGRARNAKAQVWVYLRSGNPADLLGAVVEVGPAFDDHLATLNAILDCNNDGIDDAGQIARDTRLDVNRDCILDSCQCLADWNSDGVVGVPDIFAFLSDWFAGMGDFNGDGMSTVSDIFLFLAAWFAGCGD